MPESRIESPTAPRWVRVLLLLFLPVSAGLIYWDGQHYDSDLLDFKGGQGQFSEAAGLFPDSVGGLARFGQVRQYNKDNLYEYINGHAEFFIGAGFKSLAVGEYAAEGAAEPALVVNLYDLGKGLHAFGVLMDEAGAGEAVDIGTMGFASGQGVNFILGPYYAQVTVFNPALGARDAARAVAQAMARQIKDTELAFAFPDLGEVSGTRFIKEDYRGLEMLDNVLERTFRRGDRDLAVFLINSGEVPALTAALTGFLEQDGLEYQRSEVQGLSFYQVHDPYEGEWFFLPLEQRLLGVYAPLDEDLRQRLVEFAGQRDGV